MPKATDYIPQMINFIERLITEGFAYVEEGHVLFQFPNIKIMENFLGEVSRI